ncbi:hypothetical protein [Cellulophaga sp. Z1A5H]|uniref:hypothetical protein n=1 Tax=Cellulophaga sp. Z1A5H TaxID=2687291 RepID=UPI001F1183B3|nr:hypothetical protein [Cellulophaga sp. Z1A5H]
MKFIMGKHAYILFALVVSIVISCRSQEENVELSFEKTDAPLKVMESFTMADSVYVTLLKPYRIKVKSNYSNTIETNWIGMNSGGGSGSHNPSKYLIYTDKHKLAPPPRGVKFSSYETKIFDIYIGYRMFIKSKEKNSLLENAVYLEENRERKVYDLSKSEIAPRFFEHKITDDIRGYLSFSFYNYENELGLRETIAVE